jgi:hypothetical protein
MCKLTKTRSPVLSLFLETQYVNDVTERGYARRPNLSVLPADHSSRGVGGGARVIPSS